MASNLTLALSFCCFLDIVLLDEWCLNVALRWSIFIRIHLHLLLLLILVFFIFESIVSEMLNSKLQDPILKVVFNKLARLSLLSTDFKLVMEKVISNFLCLELFKEEVFKSNLGWLVQFLTNRWFSLQLYWILIIVDLCSLVLDSNYVG